MITSSPKIKYPGIHPEKDESSHTVGFALQIRALSNQRSHKPSTVGYSIFSEAFTETGPSCHEGRNGVSVKPPLPINPAARPRACQEFLVTFVSQTKVTRPSACAASGANPPFADFAKNFPATPCLPPEFPAKRSAEPGSPIRRHQTQERPRIKSGDTRA